MKQNPYSKRPRNRIRRPPGAKGGYSPNRVFESNGPDVKLRGTAAQIHEKYLGLARDAQSGGDRVAAEGYFQYAEHYQRLLSAMHDQSDNAAPQSRGDETAREDEAGTEKAEAGNGRDDMARARRTRAPHVGRQTASPPLDEDGAGNAGAGNRRNGKAKESPEG